MTVRLLVQVSLFAVPWSIRRRLLSHFFGYQISSSAKIGYSLVLSERLVMGDGALIGHLTIVKGLSAVLMGVRATIGNLNWITGFPKGMISAHFEGDTDRDPVLELGDHAAITSRHLIDCTNKVTIGKFSTFAGFNSQILTHAIDVYVGRQISKPVFIGEYCFVGTRSVILPGSAIAAYSIVAAGAVVVSDLPESFSLYGGVPAQKIKSLDPGATYFSRKSGYVH